MDREEKETFWLLRKAHLLMNSFVIHNQQLLESSISKLVSE